MTRLDHAADTLLSIALSIFARAPRAATNEALDGLRDSLVAELGCSPAQAVAAVRGAMLRKAARSRNPETRALAKAVGR